MGAQRSWVDSIAHATWVGALAAALTLAGAGTAKAAIPATLHAPANCPQTVPAPGFAFHKCDDGVPAEGGRTPNPDGASAVTVPAKYDGYLGLPGKAPGATSVPGADADGKVALDVDVTLPTVRAPRHGYPLLFFMHGCCSGNKTSWEAPAFDGDEASGERWHYSNAWFASRGYVVVNYTARGFVDSKNRGSTGETQLDSRDYEVNDYQSLACQVLGSQSAFDDVTGREVKIDRRNVGITGGSYGGGLSWMALTDPRWRCGGGTGAVGKRMNLAVAAPRYGWTDLVYSLVPTGTHYQQPRSLPSTDGCDSGPIAFSGTDCPGELPTGIPKKSIVGILYASGNAQASDHTTFPEQVDEAAACLESAYPLEANPACADTLEHTLPQFLRERSAYYQNRFFRRIGTDPDWRVPVFSAATFTDPLFPPVEHLRMTNRMRRVAPHYPIQTYHGDYQHFVQNKAKEWGDLCDSDHHVCEGSDYPSGNYDRPAGRVRIGVSTRLGRFLDHYARPALNRHEPRPDFDVSASLQVCPQNATEAHPADEPGPLYRARSFTALARHRLGLRFEADQTTLSNAEPNPHATHSDPLGNLLSNGGRCPVETQPAGPGVATYTAAALDQRRTMIGGTRVTALFDALGDSDSVQLNARLYDVFPNGDAVMVDRGPRRLSAAEVADGRVAFQLHGNGWAFRRGHRIRIELAQDDDPFVKVSDPPSSLTLHQVRLRIPVREPVP